MSRGISASTGSTYGIALVCRHWEIPRSTMYHQRLRLISPAAGRRGRRPVVSDDDLELAIRGVLSPDGNGGFHGEGYRKVAFRLRHRGIPADRERIRRIMEERGLRSPCRPRRAAGPRNHDGRITTDRPDEMWGTDMTGTFVEDVGNVAIFLAVDHCTTEMVGLHAAVSANRFEALEPIRQGVKEHFGSYERAAAAGLSVRHDHGSQYVSRHFQEELKFLGIAASPSFIRSPEGNGCAERAVRTLKEQCLWLKRWKTLEELQDALRDFKERYNKGWLVQKHGYKTPLEIRTELLQLAA